MLLVWLLLLVIVVAYLFLAHQYSYYFVKKKILRKQKWDLNICCGKTDGGGVNVDIVKHANVPNLHIVKSIYKLPFKDKEFEHVLCSHTIEHVENPDAFYKELQRVGKNVVIVIPPLYDLWAIPNFFQHRWIFCSFKKVHINKLPKKIRLPFAKTLQTIFRQRITAP